MPGKSESVAVDYVDVASAARVAFLEHAGAFVGERGHDPRDDVVARDRRAPDAACRGGLVGELLDERIRNPVPAAALVPVPARARFLTVPSHLVQPIRNLRLRTFCARLADRLEILPDTRADV